MMDALIECICKELQQLPQFVVNQQFLVPCGGISVAKTTYLCSILGRSIELVQQYREGRMWEGNEERLKIDTLNLSTLLQINSKTRDERTQLLQKTWSAHRDDCQPYSRVMQHINTKLCEAARTSRIEQSLNILVGQLLNELLNLHLAQHPEKTEVDELDAVPVEIPPSDEMVGEALPDYFEYLEIVNDAIKELPNALIWSADVLNDLSATLSQLAMNAFLLDYGIKQVNEYFSKQHNQFPRKRNQKVEIVATDEDNMREKALSQEAMGPIWQVVEGTMNLKENLKKEDAPQGRVPLSIAESHCHALICKHRDEIIDSFLLIASEFAKALAENVSLQNMHKQP